MPKSPRITVRQADLTKAARGVRAAGIENFDLVCSPEGLIIRVIGTATGAGESDVAAELKRWSSGA